MSAADLPISLAQELNLTCASPISHLMRHLRNVSACRLTQAESSLEFVLTFYLPAVLCLTGLALNIVNFSVFRRQHFDGPAYAYMAAISLVDALFLGIYFVYILAALRCWDHPGRWPCGTKIFSYIQGGLAYLGVYFTNTLNFTLQTICAWLTVILGVERYLAMKHFHFRRTRCHRTDTKLTIVIVCVVSLLFNLPNSFHSRIVSRTRQHPLNNSTRSVISIEQTPFGSSTDYSVYSILKLGLSAIVPFILLAVNNTLLLYLVLNHQRKNYANRQKYLAVKRASKVLQASLNRIQAQKNLTILLIVVIFVFLIGQVPRSLLLKDIFSYIYSACPCGTTLLWVCCPMYRRLHPICEIIYLLCLNMNFFIYVSLNKHFRSHIRVGLLPLLTVCCRGSGATTATANAAAAVATGGARPNPDIPMDLFSAAGGTTCDCSQPPEEDDEDALKETPLTHLPLTQARCLTPPNIIYEIPANGSPTAQRRHSCVALSQKLANSVLHNMLHDCPASGASSAFIAANCPGGRPDDGFGPREELDDLLGRRTVMVSQL